MAQQDVVILLQALKRVSDARELGALSETEYNAAKYRIMARLAAYAQATSQNPEDCAHQTPFPTPPPTTAHTQRPIPLSAPFTPHPSSKDLKTIKHPQSYNPKKLSKTPNSILKDTLTSNPKLAETLKKTLNHQEFEELQLEDD